MYSSETILKLMTKANALKQQYMKTDVNGIKQTISKGNHKIGKVMNSSLMPIMTCNHCKECKHYCYDIKACVQYASCLDSRIRNTVILLKDRDKYFDTIDKAMTRRRKNKYFRWHVAGDIIDFDYFDRMVQNARNHSDFVIWTYTKEYSIVNEWIAQNGKGALPNNMHVMFSEWRGLEMVNPYNMPEFRVVFKDDENKPNAKTNHYCPGNCDVCKALNRGCVAGETTYCNEH